MIRVSWTSLFLLLSIFLDGCKQRPDNPSNNSVWVESIYLRGFKPSTGERLNQDYVKTLAQTLKENNIKYVYLFAGPYGPNGKLPPYPFSDTAKATVNFLKRYVPGVTILPWVGGIQNATIFLNDSNWVRNAVLDTRNLVETLNVPGVHIDFEFLIEPDPYLIEMYGAVNQKDATIYARSVNFFHRQLRKELKDRFISSVVVPPCSSTRPWKLKTPIDELQELATTVDQVSFLYYDTQISEQSKFYSNCLELMEVINHVKRANSKIQTLVAIGTFLNEPELQKYRDLKVENIPNSLATIEEAEIDYLNSFEGRDLSQGLIDGIAIYCDWETDINEWREFRENWRR